MFEGTPFLGGGVTQAGSSRAGREPLLTRSWRVVLEQELEETVGQHVRSKVIQEGSRTGVSEWKTLEETCHGSWM